MTSIGQTISNSEFQWIKNETCFLEEANVELFVKVEQAPRITQFNEDQFKNFIKKSIQNLHLAKHQDGMLKLKLLFTKNQKICLKEVGIKQLDLTEFQVTELSKNINSIDLVEPGRQRNIAVNCQGILYINIRNGKVNKLRIVNFRFE